MSEILNEAAICALKTAYNSYMKGKQKLSLGSRKTVDAIRSLDKSPNRLGCDLKFLCLKCELTLIGKKSTGTRRRMDYTAC